MSTPINPEATRQGPAPRCACNAVLEPCELSSGVCDWCAYRDGIRAMDPEEYDAWRLEAPDVADYFESLVDAAQQ